MDTDLKEFKEFIDFKEFIEFKDKNIYEIKEYIHRYLNFCGTEIEFTNNYNFFQNILIREDQILYYLNPLKFNKFFLTAVKEIRLDINLNYDGFLQACILCKIPQQDIDVFTDRLNKLKNMAKL